MLEGRQAMPHRRIEQVLRNQVLVHLPPTTSVRKAAEEMSQRHVAAVIVSEDSGQLDGIFTERDLLDRVVVKGLNVDKATLQQVMTANPATIDSSQTVREALAVMDGKGVRHLPVLEGGKVVGVISMRDFVGDEVASLDRQHLMEREFAETMR
jgi:signal-transduction protein with cAMP-binding, CBS, and nucleotidyltransferase domain